MTIEHPYEMTLTLNLLNHVGLNLYSNVSAVLSEVVANAWDADAETVDIIIDKNQARIITDDGHGMTREDINGKYLMVGYMRREAPGGALTPKHQRPVMGRKGIGKLSLFAVARTIEVQSVRDGQKAGFRMVLEDIQAQVKAATGGTYYPIPIDPSSIGISKGTLIVLTNLKKGLDQAESSLRKRLARRFSIIGDKHHFTVKVNGNPISITDRDYFHKVQYLWRYGGDSAYYKKECHKATHDELRPADIPSTAHKIGGWIGTVADSGALNDGQDNLNKIVIMARGKLAQEDILEDFTEGGMYTKYLIGEIHADFLDNDALEDIATSSRQKIIEDDPRYKALREFVLGELKHIQSAWTNLRNEQGEKKALEIPAINKWFGTLSKDNQTRARTLFGKINQLTIDSENERRILFKHGVLAFETLRYKGTLDALEKVAPNDLKTFAEVFTGLDDIEATLYHQIVRERIQVIEALQKHVETNALEKIVQQHLFDHLWLLDPSWERATDTPYMEQQVKKEFAGIDAKLSQDEKKGRLDIKYKMASGKHIIVELKRAECKVETSDLLKQVDKYRRALRKCLDNAGKSGEPIEVICVVGTELTDWEGKNGRAESARTLAQKDIRVIMYQELLENANKAYKAFLEKRAEAGRVYDLVRSIENDEL